MQLTCPACFARYSIEAALSDDDARRAVAAALKMPAPLGDLVLRYIGLFRAPKRALSWDRAARLIEELLAPMQAGRVERHGRTWPAPLEAWRAALADMLDRRDKLQLPLRSHGYLFEILAAQANKGEAQAEAKSEEQKRQRPHRDAGAPTAIGETAKKHEPARDPARIGAHLSTLKGAVKP
jgi:hypothetical protein